MTQPSRVLYLPPGVTLPQQALPAGGAVVSSGVPFDRAFFEQVLPPSIEAFCKQVECKVPLVELLTVDGTTHYVRGISGVSDTWVALHTIQSDHDHPVQVFIPYSTIFRVEVHPAENERRHRLGFVLEDGRTGGAPSAPFAPPAAPAATGDAPRSRQARRPAAKQG